MKLLLLVALALVLVASMAFQPSFFSTPVASQQATARATRGVLHMAKHANPKGAKKAAKNRPKKSNPYDRNRTPREYSIEISSNGRDYPGLPPVFEVVEEAA